MDDYASLVFGLFVVGFFVYLCLPSSSAASKPTGEGQSSRTERKLRARQISGATGIMGGSVEDAFISKHALDRALGDAANADLRDVATAVAMQQQVRPPE